MKVKIGASTMSDEELLAFVNNIIASGTGKPELEDVNPPLLDLTTLAGECETALTQEGTARDVLNTKSMTRSDKFDALRVKVTHFAQSVEALYAGDEAQLTAIGLPLRSPREPVGLLPAPTNLRSESGPFEGSLTVRWNKVTGRTHYNLEMATSPDGPWTQVFSKAAVATTVAGLTPGTEYWFRVCAVGKAGPSPWSDVTRRRAL